MSPHFANRYSPSNGEGGGEPHFIRPGEITIGVATLGFIVHSSRSPSCQAPAQRNASLCEGSKEPWHPPQPAIGEGALPISMGSRGGVPGSKRLRFRRPAPEVGGRACWRGAGRSPRGEAPGPPQPQRARVRQDSQGGALLPQLHENEHPSHSP